MSQEGLHTIEHPEKISSYFKADVFPLALVTVTGLIYNVGLVAGPWFEGQLVQMLFDISQGAKAFSDMAFLAISYVLVIAAVQGARAAKRFFVRRFANDTSRSMRHIIYNSLIYSSRDQLEEESMGTMMTKAVSDVDACAEGMRKVTTEIFDTGVAMASYLVMLLLYDWRLALLSCLFSPLAYVAAQGLSKVIYRSNAAYKKSAGELSDATLDRIASAITYRVFGRDAQRDQSYEQHLADYEHKAVLADIWGSTSQPVYRVISMIGVVFIVYFGSKNILGTGWSAWDLASFTTFMACFTKLAVKSSHAANLMNAIQKAQVSWRRIKPLMHAATEPVDESPIDFSAPAPLSVQHLSVSATDAQGDARKVLDDVSFKASPGEIVGITGPVASGKSTLGRAFLCEQPYQGSIEIGGHELSGLTGYERSRLVAYMGHAPELMSDSVANNVALGDSTPVDESLHMACLDGEVAAMPEGITTGVGNSGVRLSGGQQQRVALARTLYHAEHLLVLDDPFSAVDKATEREIMDGMRAACADKTILLISHRLDLFPEFSQVIWVEDGHAAASTHEALMEGNPKYRSLFEAQMAGGDLDEQ